MLVPPGGLWVHVPYIGASPLLAVERRGTPKSKQPSNKHATFVQRAMAMAAQRCCLPLLLLLLLVAAAAASAARNLDDANTLPAQAAENKPEEPAAYYGAIPGIPPGGFYGGGAIPGVPPGGFYGGGAIPGNGQGYGGIPSGGFGGGGGGWGAGYGSGPGGGGGYAHGGVEVPTTVCQEKGPCYGKKVTCPKKCFWSFSRSGNGYGVGGGGGSCTVDCKDKCTATC
ncbi:unnamed protein product [Urochloa decumbens]|uniref:Uncharacterized protein n=1 Tax=Urochloa decumbens TaxID=240449 RepID=A0ABC8VVR0_9POAL